MVKFYLFWSMMEVTRIFSLFWVGVFLVAEKEERDATPKITRNNGVHALVQKTSTTTEAKNLCFACFMVTNRHACFRGV